MPTANNLPTSESMPSQSERSRLFQNQSQQQSLSNQPQQDVLSQQQQTSATNTASQMQPKRSSDVEDGGGRSDDWCSETSSSNVGQLRQPITKGRAFVAANRHRKYTITPSASMPVVPSAVNTITENGPTKLTTDGTITDESSKKPLIAIWKAGVKLQNASAPTQTQAENNGLYSHHIIIDEFKNWMIRFFRSI